MFLDCCSSDISSEVNEENYAKVTCEIGPDVFREKAEDESRLFIDIFDMANDDENVVDMSPIREELTEIESVYGMDWVDGCPESWLVEAESCHGESLEAVCQGCCDQRV